MKQNGGIWTNEFKNQKVIQIWKFWKGPGVYLCCSNYGCYYNMVGKGEGSHGWLLGCSHERALLCATCTGMGNDEMVNNVMVMNEGCCAAQGLLAQWWNECIVTADEMDDLFRLSSWHIYVMDCWYLLLCHLVRLPQWTSVGPALCWVPLSSSSLLCGFATVSDFWPFFLFNFSLPFFFSPSLFLAVQLVLPQYLHPVRSLLSCFSLMQNITAASFCMPLLRNNLLSLIHSTAQSNLVGPLSGSFTRIGLSPFGSRSHSILCVMVSLKVSALGSQIQSRKCSGIMSWTIGLMLAFNIIRNVSASTILPIEERLAAAVDMCAWALERLSNKEIMLSIAGCNNFLVCDNFPTTSWPAGMSSSGSVLSTISDSIICQRERHLMSFTVWRTMSTSAGLICSKIPIIFCFKALMVISSTSFWSSSTSSLNWSMILSKDWAYSSAVIGLCGPLLSCSSSSSWMVTTSGASAIATLYVIAVVNCDVLDLNLLWVTRGVASTKARFRLKVFGTKTQLL